MRTAEKVNGAWKVWLGMFSVIMVLVLGLFLEQFSIVSHAQSQGKVTASSANIRKEPNASSQVVGSAAKDVSVTINHQVADSSGVMWYQVFVDANTLGYIRSDLVTITDGSTPQTVTTSSGNSQPSTTTPTTNETPAGITSVEPVGAKVTGGRNVRVRGNASTTSAIVTTAQNGLALTVIGQANGTDGKLWYQVTFSEGGNEVTGFIRSDYVALDGEVKPVTENTEPPVEPQQPTEEPQEPTVETKDWETQLQGERWMLLDNLGNQQYSITDLLTEGKTNAAAYKESQQTVKSQKVAIIILVILLLVASGAIAALVFKIKDMKDSAFISEVEHNTIRKRNEERAKSGQRVMHTVGAEKKAGSNKQTAKPQGTRPVNAPGQGGKPQGGRPQGAPTQGGKPQGGRPQGAPGQGGKPQGARPQGASAQGGRPQGAPAQGMRPQGAPAQGTRPQEAPVQGGRPQGAPEQGKAPNAAQPAKVSTQSQTGMSKNFMTDDDEFDFEFLNWDGEDE